MLDQPSLVGVSPLALTWQEGLHGLCDFLVARTQGVLSQGVTPQPACAPAAAAGGL